MSSHSTTLYVKFRCNGRMHSVLSDDLPWHYYFVLVLRGTFHGLFGSDRASRTRSPEHFSVLVSILLTNLISTITGIQMEAPPLARILPWRSSLLPTGPEFQPNHHGSDRWRTTLLEKYNSTLRDSRAIYHRHFVYTVTRQNGVHWSWWNFGWK